MNEQYDVIVVGAGTAGAAAAGSLAERGLSVLCVDRRPLDQAGARWVNGVPAWTFERAGVPLPVPPEHRGGDEEFHLVAGHGPHRLVMRDHGVLEVDMRHLVARLHERARHLGAALVGEAHVGELRGNELDIDGRAVRARWHVDASGLAGARLLEQPAVAPEHLCAAAQEVRRVRDSEAARRYFAQHGAPLGHVVCFTGVAGGFSILNVRATGDHVSILTGSIPALGHPSGRAMLDAFAVEQPWIGESLFGGSRAIPVRRPRDELARGTVALLGDAGCQVFPAHGSGIGVGLVAARMLADALAAGAGVYAYAVAWQRRYGGLLAAYDLFRRFSQTLAVTDLERLIRSGLMDADTARHGMAQSFPTVTPRVLMRKLAGVARLGDRALAARLTATLGRMAAVRGLYARYPRDPARLPAWSRHVARLFGEPADVM